MDEASRLLSRLDRVPSLARFEVPVPFREAALDEHARALLGLDVGKPRDFDDFLRRVVSHEDRDAVRAALDTLVGGRKGVDLRFRVLAADGSRVLHAVAEPILDEAGVLTRVSAVVVDVTRQHATEEQARRAAAIRFVQGLLGSVPAALLVLDEEGHILFANDRVPNLPDHEPVVGLAFETLAGDVFPTQRLLGGVQRLLEAEAGASEQWLTDLVYEGEARSLQVFLTAVPGAESVLGKRAVLVAISDMTEQVRAREVIESHAEQLEAKVRERTEQLRERARQQQALAELGALALRSPFEAVAESALAMLADTVGLGDAVVVTVQPHLQRAYLFSERFPAGDEVDFPLWTTLDGVDGVVPCPAGIGSGAFVRALPLQVSAETHGTLCIPLQSEHDLRDDVLPFVLSVAHVLSEVLARELGTLRLRHADRLAAVGRLTAGIAHQLGTPLNAISAHAGLIARKRIDGEAVVDSAHAIEEQVDRVSEQVRAVLDYARAGQREHTRVDVKAVIRRTLSVLQPIAARRRIKLLFDEVAETCWSTVPSQALQQVVTNLVDNGMDAQPGGGIVQVSIQREEHAVTVTVDDHGPGIPEEVRERIYESFFTTKAAGQGTGLGLPVARGLVREARGTLEFTSVAGQGTSFIVRLPAVTEP